MTYEPSQSAHTHTYRPLPFWTLMTCQFRWRKYTLNHSTLSHTYMQTNKHTSTETLKRPWHFTAVPECQFMKAGSWRAGHTLKSGKWQVEQQKTFKCTTTGMAHRHHDRTRLQINSYQMEIKSGFMRCTATSAISTQRKMVSGLRNPSIKVTLKGCNHLNLLPLCTKWPSFSAGKWE